MCMRFEILRISKKKIDGAFRIRSILKASQSVFILLRKIKKIDDVKKQSFFTGGRIFYFTK